MFSRSLHVTSIFFFLKNWCLCKEHCKKWILGGGGGGGGGGLLHVAIVLDPRYKLKYVKFCFEQVYEASQAVTKIALVESTFNRLYKWYNDFYSSEVGNEMNTPLDQGELMIMIVIIHFKRN